MRGRGSVYQPKYVDRHGVKQQSAVWWISFYADGQQIRESSESEKRADAVKLLAKRLHEVATGAYISSAPANIQVGALLKLVIEDYKEYGLRSLSHVRFRIRKHLEPILGHLKAKDLGTDDVRRYVAARRKAEVSNATINRELAILRRAYTIATEMDPPKATRVPKITALPEGNARQGFLEPEEYARLLPHLTRARLALVLGYHLGNRKGEILKLEWSMVNLSAAEIRIPAKIAKTNRDRVLPIYGDMASELAVAKAERDAMFPDCPWVLHDAGERVRDFRGEWAAAVKAAELPGLMFHDLRRSAVRNMIRAGIPEVVAMAISGHRTRSVFDRYNIVSGRDLADAGTKLAAYLGEDHASAKPEPKLRRVK